MATVAIFLLVCVLVALFGQLVLTQLVKPLVTAQDVIDPEDHPLPLDEQEPGEVPSTADGEPGAIPTRYPTLQPSPLTVIDNSNFVFRDERNDCLEPRSCRPSGVDVESILVAVGTDMSLTIDISLAGVIPAVYEQSTNDFYLDIGLDFDRNADTGFSEDDYWFGTSRLGPELIAEFISDENSQGEAFVQVMDGDGGIEVYGPPYIEFEILSQTQLRLSVMGSLIPHLDFAMGGVSVTSFAADVFPDEAVILYPEISLQE